MYRLDESLKELVDRNATRVLAEGGTSEGQLALHRMFLLLSMIDRLEAADDSWAAIDLLPTAPPYDSDQELQVAPS